MKKIKKVALSILGVTLLTTGLYSCSDDSENNTNSQIENSITKAKVASVVSFLKEYYNGEKFDLGREIIINNIAGDFKLSEILLENSDRLGYVVEDVNTKEFLYFADKNLKNDEIIFQDIKNQEMDILTKISSDSIFNSTKEFDLIYVVDEIKKASPIALGWTKRFNIDRLWKNDEKTCGSIYRDGDENSPTLGMCVQDCSFRSYRFFIGGRTKTLEGIPTDTNDCK